jgi:predicted TIM-barrel fold metal-dependent hydrolase
LKNLKIVHIKGIRYFFESGEEVLSQRVIKNLQYLGAIKKSFDVVVPPKWLSQANELIKLCPDTRFIIDHCGNADPKAFYPPEKPRPSPPEHDPEQWRKDIAEIALHPNVVCKISGIVSRVRNNPVDAEDVAPIINHCLDSFGPDRVMFAGDWPVCLKNMPLASWVNLLKQVVQSRSETDQRKLFYENAARFYQI